MISSEDLATLIGGDDYDAAKVEDIERGAVAFVQTQTGRYFGPPEAIEEFVTGSGSRRLYLRDHVTRESGEYDDPPVVDVVERAYPGGDPTSLAQDVAFELRQTEKEFQLSRLAAEFWTSRYEYGVTYWRGYQPGEEPADIRDLVLSLVRFRWENTLEERGGLRSETIGGYSYTRFGNDDIEAVSGSATIEAWHRPVFA